MNYYQCPQGNRNTCPPPPKSPVPMPMPVQAGKTLAIAYVPWQKYEELFPDEAALSNGTIFKELCLPFCGKRSCK